MGIDCEAEMASKLSIKLNRSGLGNNTNVIQNVAVAEFKDGDEDTALPLTVGILKKHDIVAGGGGLSGWMTKTNVFRSGNPRVDAEIRQFETQAFFNGLPPKIQFVVLQRNVESLTLWVKGFQQPSPNAPDKLAGLDLEVWLLRNDGTAAFNGQTGGCHVVSHE
ncbi:MAG: hypothetical protein ACREFR_19960 [Limisphaerales bacterium]